MSALQATDSLLRSPIFSRGSDNPDLVEGYASGELATLSARTNTGTGSRLGRAFAGRFTRPRYQRSPDREKSIQRRRELAASGPIPPKMAGMLTTSQVAYARIVADEVYFHGRCDLTLDEIAARGGMSRKTAKRAQDRLGGGNRSRDPAYKIEGLGWITVEERPVPGRKHLSNAVVIVSSEWVMWITMGPKPRRRIGGHPSPTTGNLLNPYATIAPVGGWKGAYEMDRHGRLRLPANKGRGIERGEHRRLSEHVG